VIYLEDTYRSLVKFLLKTLDPGPGSEVILAKSYNLKTKKFFALAEQEFVIKMSTIGYKEKGASGPEGEKHLAQIVRMRSKKICSC
jgi:hypothetical protein